MWNWKIKKENKATPNKLYGLRIYQDGDRRFIYYNKVKFWLIIIKKPLWNLMVCGARKYEFLPLSLGYGYGNYMYVDDSYYDIYGSAVLTPLDVNPKLKMVGRKPNKSCKIYIKDKPCPISCLNLQEVKDRFIDKGIEYNSYTIEFVNTMSYIKTMRKWHPENKKDTL